MDQKKFEQISAKNAEIVRENLKLMMESTDSVFDYDPYTRWYLDNQETEPKPKKNSSIVQRIDNVKKRTKK